jgi:hypothetical protein
MKSASFPLHSYQSNLMLFPSRPSKSYSLLVIHEPANSLHQALLLAHDSLCNLNHYENFLKYVYQSIKLYRLITYSPYSNKFENPLLLSAKDSFLLIIIFHNPVHVMLIIRSSINIHFLNPF